MVFYRLLAEAARPIIGAAGVVAFAVSIVSCAPKGVPQIPDPNHVDSYCSIKPVHELPRITAVDSIMTSVYERLPAPGAAPSLAQYRVGLRTTHGVIAYYQNLQLLKPELAKTFGEPGDYLIAHAVMIDNERVTRDERYIYLELRDHGTYRWKPLLAADTQNVCSEGHRMM